jgi:hypothetical protein
MRQRFLYPLAAVLVMLSGAWAQNSVSFPLAPKRPEGGQAAVDLLYPVREFLSGRPWLMAEGIDPGLQERPGWDPLTRMDWQGLGGAMTGGGSVMQAPAGAAFVPFRDPAPAFSRDVLVTRDYSQSPFQTEPHLAVNPHDPEHLVLGVIDYNFPTTSSYVSFDGGEIWEGPFQVPYILEDRVSGGDPVLVFDREGNVYYASISIGVEEFTVGPVVVFSMVSSMAVAKSEDGGFTWPQTVSTARSRVSTEALEPDRFGRLRGNLTVGFLDKPWMNIGPHPDNPEREVLYLTYTDFEVNYEVFWIGEVPVTLPTEMMTTIRVVSSEDGGNTWTDPVAVSPTVRRGYGERETVGAPGVFGTRRVVQGSQPAIGSDGTVYVAWLDSTDDGSMEGLAEIHVAHSRDGGRTFSAPVVASVFNEIQFRPRNAFFRYWGSAFPQLAIGPNDELYVVYTGRPPGNLRDDGDIFFVASLDGGQSWGRPVRLNDDDGDALQFFPSIDVDPNGIIHVMWGDMRDDPSQIRYHIYYTRSEDGGETWGFELAELGYRVGDTRVTDFSSNPNRGFPFGLFIGDYFSLKATENDVYMVWADTRMGEFGGPNQKIGFARQRGITQPEIFISPPAGAGGQEVTIQGFNFQPDINVFVQLEDVTIAVTRTNAEGRFTTNLYMPITGEGPQTVRAVDASGNMAAGSYFTEFGFGDIQDLYRDLSRQLDDIRQQIPDTGAEAEAPQPETRLASLWNGPGSTLVLAVLFAGFLVMQRRVGRKD